MKTHYGGSGDVTELVAFFDVGRGGFTAEENGGGFSGVISVMVAVGLLEL